MNQNRSKHHNREYGNEFTPKILVLLHYNSIHSVQCTVYYSVHSKIDNLNSMQHRHSENPTLFEHERHSGVILIGVNSRLLVRFGKSLGRRADQGSGGRRRRSLRDEKQSGIAFAESRQPTGDFVRSVRSLAMGFQVLGEEEEKEERKEERNGNEKE